MSHTQKWTIIAFMGIIGCAASDVLAADAVGISPGAVDTSVLIGEPCPTFSWSPVAETETYELAVFETFWNEPQGYADRVALYDPVFSETLPAPGLSWTPSSESCLAQSISYVWYVRDIGTDGAGPWSAGNYFTVDTTLAVSAVGNAIQQAVKTHLLDTNTIEQIIYALESYSTAPEAQEARPAMTSTTDLPTAKK